MFVVIKSKAYLKQGHARIKTRSVGQILEKYDVLPSSCFLEGTVLIQSSKKIPRMFISMKSRSYLKLSPVRSKTKS